MILFDLDGTIVDSSPAVLRGYNLALEATLGFRLDPDEDHKHELLRRRPLEYFQQHYPPHAQELAKGYAESYRSDPVKAYSGMVELMNSLADQGPIGIVSNKGRARIEKDLIQVGLSPSIFTVIVGAEDTEKRKPHPEPILKAYEMLGIEVPIGIYVGDGPHDVVAGNAAGLKTVAVNWGYYPEAALKAAEPTWQISETADLKSLLLDIT